MSMQNVAAAMQRAETVFRRRPQAGLHDDVPATIRWESGTRFISKHPNGAQIATDMPVELGGTGDQVSPGWLFRAGLASCAATCIAMGAAAEGIELTALEVVASSRSDTRGLLRMTDVNGEPVPASSRDLQMRVRIAARGVEPERLRTLVERGVYCSPICGALREAAPVGMQIEVDVL